MKTLTQNIQKTVLLLICAQLALPSHGLSLLGTAWAEESRAVAFDQQLPELFTPGINEAMVANKNEALEVCQEIGSIYFCSVVKPKSDSPVDHLDASRRKTYDHFIKKSYYQNEKNETKRKKKELDLALRLLHQQADALSHNRDKKDYRILKAWLKEYHGRTQDN